MSSLIPSINTSSAVVFANQQASTSLGEGIATSNALVSTVQSSSQQEAEHSLEGVHNPDTLVLSDVLSEQSGRNRGVADISPNACLPLELVLAIFAYLSIEDIYHCALMSRVWYGAFKIALPESFFLPLRSRVYGKQTMKVDAFLALDKVQNSIKNGSEENNKIQALSDDTQNSFVHNRPFRELIDNINLKVITKGHLPEIMSMVFYHGNDAVDVPLKEVINVLKYTARLDAGACSVNYLEMPKENLKKYEYLYKEYWGFFRKNISNILILNQTGEFNLQAFLKIPKDALVSGIVGKLSEFSAAWDADNNVDQESIARIIELMLENKVFWILHENVLYPNLMNPILWILREITISQISEAKRMMWKGWIEKFIVAGMEISIADEISNPAKRLFNKIIEYGYIDIFNCIIKAPLKEYEFVYGFYGKLLCTAIKKGKVEIAEILIKIIDDIDQVNADYAEPHIYTYLLNIAIQRKRNEIIEKFDRKKVDFNIRDLRRKTPLHLALYTGNYEIVEFLLYNGAKPNRQDDKGNTPLSIAIKNKAESHNIISKLKEYGAIENFEDEDEEFQFYVTAVKGNIEKFNYFFNKGIKPNWKNYKSETVLEIACQNGHVDMVHVLLGKEKKSYNERYQLLSQALTYRENHFNVIQVLLDTFKNSSEKDDKNTLLPNNFLFRVLKALGHRPELIKFLIQYGLDPNGMGTKIYGEKGCSIDLNEAHIEPYIHVDMAAAFSGNALHTAIKKGYKKEIIEVVADRIADINQKNNEGNTALHYAIQAGYRWDTIRLLLKKKPNLELVNKEHKSALDFFNSESDLEAIRALVKYAAQMRHPGLKNNSILENAIKNKCVPEAILALQLQGQDKDEKNISHQSPMHFAIENDWDPESIKALKYTVQDMDQKYFGGDTLLHFAIRKNALLEIIKVLLELKPNPDVQNDVGDMPLHVAINSESPSKIIAILLFTAKAKSYVRNNDKDTPLHIAIRKRSSLKTIRAVLTTDNRDVQNGVGDTPLHMVIREGASPEIIQMLLNARVRRNLLNDVEDTPLHLAIRKGRSLEIIQMLLNAGAYLNSPNNDKDTPLHLAIREGASPEIIQTLLNTGANPTLLNADKCTPLHIAIKEGSSPEIIKTLLNAGAKRNISNGVGDTPLHMAIKEGSSPEIIQMLLNAGANPNLLNADKCTPLHIAIKEGSSPEIIRILLNAGAKQNLSNGVGDTPLHMAIKEGSSPEIIQMILNARANPNAQDNNQDTPLNLAIIKNCDIEIIKMLAVGANLNLPGTDGLTPIRRAIQKGDLKIIVALQSRGDHKDLEEHQSALHFAIKNRWSSELIKELIYAIRDVKSSIHNNNYYFKNTILHFAVKVNSLPEIIKILLKAKVDQTILNEDQDTPLHMAIREGRPLEIIQMLVNENANLNKQNNFKNTPLHLAMIGNSDIKIIQMLAANTDLDLRNADDLTPMKLAIQKGDSKVILALQLKGQNSDPENIAHQSPMHFAIQAGKNPKDIEALGDIVEDINQLDSKKDTLLQFAIKCAIKEKACINGIQALLNLRSCFEFSLKNLLLLRKVFKAVKTKEAEAYKELAKSLSLAMKRSKSSIFNWPIQFSIWCFSF